MSAWKLPRLLILWMCALLVYLFLLGPIAIIVIASFDSAHVPYFRFPPQGFSLWMYTEIPSAYIRALAVSIALATAASLIACALGTMGALALTRGRFAAPRSVLYGFFNLPMQIPLVVTGVVFLQFYNLCASAVGVDLLGSFAGLLVAHVFITLPYSLNAVGVVLQKVNPRVEEAAESLGASPWSVFRRVTFPAIRPGIFTGLFYAFIVSFGDVPVSLFIASDRVMPLPTLIFSSLQVDFQQTILAMSTIVILISAALIVLIQKLIGLDLIVPSNRK